MDLSSSLGQESGDCELSVGGKSCDDDVELLVNQATGENSVSENSIGKSGVGENGIDEETVDAHGMSEKGIGEKGIDGQSVDANNIGRNRSEQSADPCVWGRLHSPCWHAV